MYFLHSALPHKYKVLIPPPDGLVLLPTTYVLTYMPTYLLQCAVCLIQVLVV